ncbi:MAG: class I SAM-dependent methyltransferase [Dehalococcoidia bacterium]|nr:class I SAM-dependent methyltransferase [Dehalococcoidia bacterium]
MWDKRIPLREEPIADMDAVRQYDRGARHIMMPQYKYFVWKITRKGIRGGKILDVGTGSGLLAIELAKVKGNQFDITGIDISENMVRKAIENAQQAKTGDKTKFAVADAAALPFRDKTFDLVVSYASLHHWRDPAAVFEETARVVKDTGRIIIRDNKRVYRNPCWRAFIWLISIFINRRHRENWPKAIMACYTMPEIKEIMQKVRSKNYRVTSDFIRFDMSIEWP